MPSASRTLEPRPLTRISGGRPTAEKARTGKRSGAPRFLQVSTDEVYGSVETGSSKETDPLEPRSPYSASKAGSDLIALSYHSTYGTPVTVTRCTNNLAFSQSHESDEVIFSK